MRLSCDQLAELISKIDKNSKLLLYNSSYVQTYVRNQDISFIVNNYDKIVEELEYISIKTCIQIKTSYEFYYMEITAGGGGIDAQSCAEMLMNIYENYFKKYTNISYDIIHKDKTVNGIRSAMIRIKGFYKDLLSEIGIHRIVRKSPFSNGKRQTSFVNVNIFPLRKIDPLIISTKDLVITTYKSSGPGGQHANKTDSAVRIKNTKYNITVESSKHRSQHANKKNALEILTSKIENIRRNKLKESQSSNVSNKVNFGTLFIRSYTLDNNIIHDLRNSEKKSPNSILKGNLSDINQQVLLYILYEKYSRI